MELTLEELEALEPGSYTLLDLRSEQEAAYGTCLLYTSRCV